ncbi:MAG: hypothetical protein ACFB2Z_09170 [Maricaulaceae bacterium]
MTEGAKNPPPVAVHRDGAVNIKIWRNIAQDGQAFYSATFGRTYTDPASGQLRESASFQGAELLKLQQLAGEAYRSIGQLRAHDQAQDRARELAAEQMNAQSVGAQPAPAQAPGVQPPPQSAPGLEEQRDAAMTQAPAPQQQSPSQDAATPTPNRAHTPQQ